MKTWTQKAGLKGTLVGMSIIVFALTSACAPSLLSGEKGDALTVRDGKRVSIEYTMTLRDKTQVGTNVGGNPVTYTHGGQAILPALQKALVGLKVGESKQVTLSSEDGYGAVNPKAFQEVGKSSLPTEAHKVGTPLVVKDDAGRTHHWRVHELKEKTVVLDFNHPLAGQTLIFEVKVLKVEDPAH